EDAAAGRSFLESVSDFVLEAFHFWHAGRRGVVDKHGDVKIASGEGVSDVGEMGADGVAASGVVRIVDFDLDGTSVGLEQEVVSCGRLGETHALFAAVIHLGMVMSWGGVGGLLGVRIGGLLSQIEGR